MILCLVKLLCLTKLSIGSWSVKNITVARSKSFRTCWLINDAFCYVINDKFRPSVHNWHTIPVVWHSDAFRYRITHLTSLCMRQPARATFYGHVLQLLLERVIRSFTTSSYLYWLNTPCLNTCIILPINGSTEGPPDSMSLLTDDHPLPYSQVFFYVWCSAFQVPTIRF